MIYNDLGGDQRTEMTMILDKKAYLSVSKEASIFKHFYDLHEHISSSLGSNQSSGGCYFRIMPT